MKKLLDIFKADGGIVPPNEDKPKAKVIDTSVRPDVKLGYRCREKVTGFEGIAVVLSHEVDGTLLVGLQPQSTDNGKPSESYEFDVERIEVLDTEAAIPNTNAEVDRSTVQLGAEYRDKVTGYTGIAVSRWDFLGGCTRIQLRAKVKKDGTLPEGLAIPIERAELVKPEPKEEPVKPTKTGGPGSTDKAMLARMGKR